MDYAIGFGCRHHNRHATLLLLLRPVKSLYSILIIPAMSHGAKHGAGMFTVLGIARASKSYVHLCRVYRSRADTDPCALSDPRRRFHSKAQSRGMNVPNNATTRHTKSVCLSGEALGTSSELCIIHVVAHVTVSCLMQLSSSEVVHIHGS